MKREVITFNYFNEGIVFLTEKFSSHEDFETAMRQYVTNNICAMNSTIIIYDPDGYLSI